MYKKIWRIILLVDKSQWQQWVSVQRMLPFHLPCYRKTIAWGTSIVRILCRKTGTFNMEGTHCLDPPPPLQCVRTVFVVYLSKKTWDILGEHIWEELMKYNMKEFFYRICNLYIADSYDNWLWYSWWEFKNIIYVVITKRLALHIKKPTWQHGLAVKYELFIRVTEVRIA